MTATYESLDHALRQWADGHGIHVADRDLGREKPGTFDGPTVVVNPAYAIETRSLVLAHSMGSTVVWTLEKKRAQAVYDELREAKRARIDQKRFDHALADWSAFEETTHEYAAGLLGEVGHAWAVEPYTEFARADGEMMLAFHSGQALVWQTFFPEWRARLARGEVDARPFKSRAVPEHFRPVHFPQQEVHREEDGTPDD